MLQEHSLPETLDPSSSSADPSLTRSTSLSRLNAQAREFVPTRPDPVRIVHPPPPPVVLHRVFAPFHAPTGPGQHQSHAHAHHQHHHVQYRSKQQYYGGGGGGGFREQEVVGVNRKSQVVGGSDSENGGISDEATQKVLNQVEYYFSDLNLATTDHLIKYISKDPEGYVPLSVVAAFKKIKAFITGQAHLASILQKSSKLVVSEDGKKIKRQHPFTESDMEELQSRIVVAENLPEDHCHQNLMRIFSAVGSVKTIRTCQPQNLNGNGSSASRQAKADGMLFSNKLHAFVEYESVDLAEKAVAELTDERNWRSGLRVRLMLVRRGSKPTQGRGKRGGNDGEGQFEEDDASTSEQHPNEKQSEDTSQLHESLSYENAGEWHAHEEVQQRKGPNRGRGKGRGRGRGQYHQNNRGNHHTGTPPNSMMYEQQQPTVAKQPPGPRMPDGTRGFAMGRGKPIVA